MDRVRPLGAARTAGLRAAPELGLKAPAQRRLTYYPTPALALCGRAIAFSTLHTPIPIFHSPTDTVETLFPLTIGEPS